MEDIRWSTSRRRLIFGPFGPESSKSWIGIMILVSTEFGNLWFEFGTARTEAEGLTESPVAGAMLSLQNIIVSVPTEAWCTEEIGSCLHFNFGKYDCLQILLKVVSWTRAVIVYKSCSRFFRGLGLFGVSNWNRI